MVTECTRIHQDFYDSEAQRKEFLLSILPVLKGRLSIVLVAALVAVILGLGAFAYLTFAELKDTRARLDAMAKDARQNASNVALLRSDLERSGDLQQQVETINSRTAEALKLLAESQTKAVGEINTTLAAALARIRQEQAATASIQTDLDRLKRALIGYSFPTLYFDIIGQLDRDVDCIKRYLRYGGSYRC